MTDSKGVAQAADELLRTGKVVVKTDGGLQEAQQFVRDVSMQSRKMVNADIERDRKGNVIVTIKSR